MFVFTRYLPEECFGKASRLRALRHALRRLPSLRPVAKRLPRPPVRMHSARLRLLPAGPKGVRPAAPFFHREQT